MNAYKVKIKKTTYHGYKIYDLLWDGVSTFAKPGKRLYRIIDLWSGGFAINNKHVDCYDIDGAIDTCKLDLVKAIQKKHPRSKVTYARLTTTWAE